MERLISEFWWRWLPRAPYHPPRRQLPLMLLSLLSFRLISGHLRGVSAWAMQVCRSIRVYQEHPCPSQNSLGINGLYRASRRLRQYPNPNQSCHHRWKWSITSLSHRCQLGENGSCLSLHNRKTNVLSLVSFCMYRTSIFKRVIFFPRRYHIDIILDMCHILL